MSALRKRRAWAIAGLIVAVGLVVVLLSSGQPTPAPPAATPPLPKAPALVGPAAWLGLNYNSGSTTGSLTDFAVRGIVYDREGALEVRAGTTPQNSPKLASGLVASHAARMVPDIVVNSVAGPPGCTTNPSPRKICLPTGEAQVSSYVQGFVQTARSVRARDPHERVLFEPTNEPWDWAYPRGTR